MATVSRHDGLHLPKGRTDTSGLRQVLLMNDYDVLFEPVRIGPKIALNHWTGPHCNGLGYLGRDLTPPCGGQNRGWLGVVCTEEVEIHPSGDIAPCIEGGSGTTGTSKATV